jgi:hypothetical protein
MSRAARLVTTRTGIQIGALYQPPPPRPGLYAERIQAALLEPRTTQPLTGWRRLLGYLWSKA